MHSSIVVSSLFLCAVAFAAVEQAPPPPWFPPPSGYTLARSTYADYDELNMQVPPQERKIQGKVWRLRIEPVDPADKKADCKKEIQPRLKQALQHDGFRFVHEDWILQRGDGEHVTYVKFSGCDVYILEPQPNPMRPTLRPPGATPETIGARDDVPYLSPVEGSTLLEGKKLPNEAWHFVLPCDSKIEARGTGTVVRRYRAPKNSSDLELRDAYEVALRAAGWDPVCRSSGVTAHYTRNHRDIWGHVTFATSADPPSYTIEARDTGAELRDALKRSCKASLYGINFDFNKATLRPESEPVLEQVRSLLTEQSTLAVEIGGHTDNVGKPDYNLHLSDERAAAVKTWLVAHGVAATRLSSRGYGDTQPLAPNINDENRARNRRVEIKRAGCQ